jgi:phosphoglycerate-specific signal transduction histidine kinase
MIDSDGNETKTIYEAVLLEELTDLREELEALKQSIPKIKVDAIRDAKEATRTANTDTGQAWLCRVIDLENYANMTEDGS